MQQNTANRKDQLEPGQREKGNTVFGSHPLLAQHDAQGQHCACSTDEDAAHSHPCVGFLNTRSCEHPPPSYHAAQLSYSELFLSVHNSHLLREPFIIVAYYFFFSPPPCRMKKFQLLKAHISLLTVSLFTDSHRYTQTNSAWESTAQPGALQPEHQTELGHHSNK